jgi:cation-dependent mannose-6-phosphate receptor
VEPLSQSAGLTDDKATFGRVSCPNLTTTAEHHSIPFYFVAPRRYQICTTHPTMQFPSLPNTLLLALALHHGVNAAASDDKNTKPLDPCTIASASGSFFDLRPLSIAPPIDGKKPAKGEKTASWHAKGYDYKSNFTLNICAPVVEELDDVVGIDSKLWSNVSAYYESGSEIFSLG